MRVAILGCGYVGLELGRRLTGADHHVVGVRRSASGVAAVEEAGLEAIRGDVTDAGDLSAVPDVDAVVFAASAGGRDAAAARQVYVEGLRTVVDHFGGREPPPDRLVYTSSTGVYGDHGGDWVDESTPPSPVDDRTAALIDAEAVATGATGRGIDPTVVRFGGIYGPTRYRIDRYLDGPVTAGYLNLIHRDDAAGVLAYLLETGRGRDEVLVAVDDEPVDRRTLAGWLADSCGVAPPATRTVEEHLAAADPSSATGRRLGADKRCSNDRLRDLGYEFAYPTFRDGFAGAVAERE